ncbi:DNA-binding response regulator [Paenibacillus sp. J5C_2022]|uniref:DNA-binding response regulator n=1 Tax=Paenibacillus sp. J5C2022 TaxID=2977129 RepID=UPI0021CF1A8B|nr:DNA-binding response regulator [Paenibacillus sp. J5C2022]MCU6711782.1 DNA-binding response regulator [Paenibacillus sp. J5C2022]
MMVMKYEEMYGNWINEHLQQRAKTSERWRRLKEGHGHAESDFAKKIWLEAVEDFSYLHPEYEVCDYRDRSRFLDFAYIRPPYRICIEIDGYSWHNRNISRRQFSDDLFRQNDLIMDGWIMIRFSYDDVKDNPRLCQQYVQQLLGKLYGSNKSDPIMGHILPVQREILRFISRQTGNQICSPMQIATSLSLHPSTVRRNMKQLVSVGLLEGASATQAAYIRRYRLTVRGARLQLH